MNSWASDKGGYYKTGAFNPRVFRNMSASKPQIVITIMHVSGCPGGLAGARVAQYIFWTICAGALEPGTGGVPHYP